VNRSDACTRVHHQSARGVDRLLTTRVPRVYTTVHERSCRVSATVLTRDFAAIFPTNLRDKTDTDSRGVNDPRATTGITVAIDGGVVHAPSTITTRCPAVMSAGKKRRPFIRSFARDAARKSSRS